VDSAANVYWHVFTFPVVEVAIPHAQAAGRGLGGSQACHVAALVKCAPPLVED